MRARKPDERRAAEPAANEDLSDEYLAVVVVCGGTVRESDWGRLPASVAARRLAASPDADAHAHAHADARDGADGDSGAEPDDPAQPERR